LVKVVTGKNAGIENYSCFCKKKKEFKLLLLLEKCLAVLNMTLPGFTANSQATTGYYQDVTAIFL